VPMVSFGLAATLVADVLLLSAGFKATHYREYASAARSFNAVRHLGPVVNLLVVAIPVVEAALGGLILLPDTRDIGLLGSCIVAVLFVFVLQVDDRRVLAHCGCWGAVSPDVPRSHYLFRSAVLAALASAALGAEVTSSNMQQFDAFEVVVLACATLPVALLLLESPQIIHLVRTQHRAFNRHPTWG
jgi:hypothetical protein